MISTGSSRAEGPKGWRFSLFSCVKIINYIFLWHGKQNTSGNTVNHNVNWYGSKWSTSETGWFQYNRWLRWPFFVPNWTWPSLPALLAAKVFMTMKPALLRAKPWSQIHRCAKTEWYSLCLVLQGLVASKPFRFFPQHFLIRKQLFLSKFVLESLQPNPSVWKEVLSSQQKTYMSAFSRLRNILYQDFQRWLSTVALEIAGLGAIRGSTDKSPALKLPSSRRLMPRRFWLKKCELCSCWSMVFFTKKSPKKKTMIHIRYSCSSVGCLFRFLKDPNLSQIFRQTSSQCLPAFQGFCWEACQTQVHEAETTSVCSPFRRSMLETLAKWWPKVAVNFEQEEQDRKTEPIIIIFWDVFKMTYTISPNIKFNSRKLPRFNPPNGAPGTAPKVHQRHAAWKSVSWSLKFCGQGSSWKFCSLALLQFLGCEARFSKLQGGVVPLLVEQWDGHTGIFQVLPSAATCGKNGFRLPACSRNPDCWSSCTDHLRSVNHQKGIQNNLFFVRAMFLYQANIQKIHQKVVAQSCTVNCSFFQSSRALQVSGDMSRNFVKPLTLPTSSAWEVGPCHMPSGWVGHWSEGDVPIKQKIITSLLQMDLQSIPFGAATIPKTVPRCQITDCLTIITQNSSRSMSPDPSVSKYSKNSWREKNTAGQRGKWVEMICWSSFPLTGFQQNPKRLNLWIYMETALVGKNEWLC